jgi:putative DNA primase/helicase
MSRAREIAPHLEGAPEGNGWRCRCPVHQGRSLNIADGIGGRLLVKCWGGCSTAAVLAELRRLDLIGGSPPTPLTPEQIAAQKAAKARNDRRRIAWAHEIFREASPLRRSRGDEYLLRRGVDAFSPYFASNAESVLRFSSHCYYAKGIYRPAIVAKVEHVERGHTATHRTYLSMDGSGKTTLDPPRKTVGVRDGAAIRLAAVQPGQWLVIGEGIENVLSVMTACSLPGWAATCADGLRSLVLPPEATHVVIAADNDANGVGPRMARQAAQRFASEGRRVKVAMPPRPDGVDKVDFNDVLLGRAYGQIADGGNG